MHAASAEAPEGCIYLNRTRMPNSCVAGGSVCIGEDFTMVERPSKFNEVAEKSKAKRARLKATVAARDAEKARIEKAEEARRAKYGLFPRRFEAWDDDDLLNRSELLESKPAGAVQPAASEKSRENAALIDEQDTEPAKRAEANKSS